MKLRRSTPFLARPTTSVASHDGHVLLLDMVEIPPTGVSNTKLISKISASLTLGAGDAAVAAERAIALVDDQYDACLEYIYSHPLWKDWRAGRSPERLLAYLIETRHYLAAAPLRMAPGIGGALTPNELNRLQARHMVEEADHDTFFENALHALGCPRHVVRAARPSPVTTEWIHLMRAVAEVGPLCAALCSGLLETTARDKAAVVGWHEMLTQSGMLDESVVSAIFAHVETDLGLGHGSNWRDAIRAAQVIPVRELAECLNGITLVAEMIVRWLDSLADGLATELVQQMPTLAPVPEVPPRSLAADVDGLPVWPAMILRTISHGADSDRPAVRSTLALAYAFDGALAAQSGAAGAARDFAARLAPVPHDDLVANDPVKLVESWLVAIDGHELWTELIERPTSALALGYMLENHHYVASIWQHAGAAIAACGDPVVRAQLVHHLDEEFEHAALFRGGIEPYLRENYPGVSFDALRPLPTTIAFTGALRGLAQRDWQSYVLALGFLQLSLRAGADGTPDQRHTEFYERLLAALPQARPLISAMRRHDEEDSLLGHGSDTREMLTTLVSRHHVTTESVRLAAIVPQLAWSFLDGIQRHFTVGDTAVVQRIGWHLA
jgi:pyrroloquinoline quinone (PQQ) biosynthesis protein C